MPRRRRQGLAGRAEAFEILYDYKMGDIDIGEAYEAILSAGFQNSARVSQRRRLAPQYEKIVRPKKRRKTAYQSAYSAAYKRLKKKHPRMSFGSLSKKAHAAARKKVK